MRKIEQRYERDVDLTRLVQHPLNPRRGNLEVIAESIQANGFYGVVVAQQSTGFILAGNHRTQAVAREGGSAVDVIWLDVNDDEAKRILSADNRTNDVSSYDEFALAHLLRDMPDLRGTGYSSSDLEEMLGRMEQYAAPQLATDAAPPPDPPAPPAKSADQSAAIKPKYEVIVMCRNEPEQVEVMTLLQERQYLIKALVS